MYQGTSTPFANWPAAALADMGAALNPEPVAEFGDYFRLYRDGIAGAAAEVATAAALLREAHDGAAAGAVQAHLGRLLAIGDVGQGQALQASVALADQADYAAWARTRLGAAEGLREPTGGLAATGFPNVAAAYENEVNLVRDAAAVYETNTNVNYTTNFQPYEPPPDLAVDPAATGAGTGSGGVGAFPAGLGGPASGGGLPPGAGGIGTGGGAGASPLVGGLPAAAAGLPVIGAVGAPGLPIPGTGSAGGGSAVPSATAVGPGAAGMPRGGAGAVPPAPGGGRSLDGAAFGPGVPPLGPGSTTGLGPRGGPGTAGPGPRAGSGGPGPGLRGGSGGPGPGLRAGPGGPGGGIGSPGNPAPPGGSGAGRADGSARGAAGPPAGSGGRGLPGAYGAPLLGAGAGSRSEEGHRRPPWLVEDDPDEIWFAGLPPHTEPVISARPREDRGVGRGG